ncbi:helix-turn-helix domain-containing protein [Streptomyces sp. 3211]|uniref:helix-turn-helix domain-containing protein n=1 Tax=Streptomyces sp. 3211 TaxID=1964449 RepID=UPI0013314DD8|nr:helix-turn-helix domain-containing protein [Streptomyces sp. 3211]
MRLKAVSSLLGGGNPAEVAALFNVSTKAVEKWLTQWQEGGWNALASRPRGRKKGDHQILSKRDQAAVCAMLLGHTPADHGYSGELWTRKLVGELIADLHGVQLTDPGVGIYLKRWGISFPYSRKNVTGQTDPVRIWREKTWPKIQAAVKIEKAKVFLIDRVSIDSKALMDEVWKFPNLGPPHTDSLRRQLSAVGAINTHGRVYFFVAPQPVEMHSFLDRLASDHPNRKTYFIFSPFAGRDSDVDRMWIEKNQNGISLHFISDHLR